MAEFKCVVRDGFMGDPTTFEVRAWTAQGASEKAAKLWSKQANFGGQSSKTLRVHVERVIGYSWEFAVLVRPSFKVGSKYNG